MKKKPQARDSPLSSRNLENELIKIDNGAGAHPKNRYGEDVRQDMTFDETSIVGIPIPGTSPAPISEEKQLEAFYKLHDPQATASKISALAKSARADRESVKQALLIKYGVAPAGW